MHRGVWYVLSPMTRSPVARPVLTTSERLSDEDLVAVALAKGREHMLAISERMALTEPVTDVLVKRGDRIVAHAVAGNPGARFSEDGFAALAERAKADEALRLVLSERDDVDPERLRQLMAIAKEKVRDQLTGSGQGRDTLDQALELGTLSLEAEIVPGARELPARHGHDRGAHRGTPARGGRSCRLCRSRAVRGMRLRGCPDGRPLGYRRRTLVRRGRCRTPDGRGAGARLDLVNPARDVEKCVARKRRSRISCARRARPSTKLRPKTAERVMHFLKAREASQQRASRKAAIRVTHG